MHDFDRRSLLKAMAAASAIGLVPELAWTALPNDGIEITAR